MYRIFSPDREPLGALEQFTSMQWTRRWHTAGAFALKLPYTRDMWELLARENLIVSGDEAGIIEGRWLEYDKGDVIQIKGRMLAGYADRRLIWGVVSARDTPENIMRQLVTNNMTVGDRAIQGLAVAASAGYGTAIDFQEENKNLLDALEALSESSGLGFDIAFAPGGLTFRVLQGIDRSAEQSTNPRAIFSREFENVLSQKFTDDAQKHRNVVKVDFDNAGAVITETVGASTGRDRREIFLKASGLAKDAAGTTLTEAQQRALMAEKGRDKFTPVEQALTVQADPFGNLKYRTDYDLGDIVTVVGWGMMQDLRITQIKEIHEEKGFGLELTFGNISSLKKIARWLIGG